MMIERISLLSSYSRHRR